MPHEIPEWVKDTPDECAYDLTMFDSLGSSIQRIDLTRDEFLTLKQHLATMRGYAIANAGPALPAAPNETSREPRKVGTRHRLPVTKQT